jgi:CheY-like chemotaxis protein
MKQTRKLEPMIEDVTRKDPIMNPEIKLAGFEPTEDFKKSIQKDIGRLLDLCPSDSVIDTYIKHTKTGRFEMVLTINYLGGNIMARSNGNTLSETTQSGLDQAYDQLKFWRDGRLFEDVSQWNTSTQSAIRPVPKILIVDDERTSTRLLEQCLINQGCETTVATSGQEAVEKILASPYDLVFLDWTMPDMNGGEALLQVERINSLNPATDHQWSALRLPIITYSADAKANIEIPACRHFRFLDHWEKSQSYSQLVHQAQNVIARLTKGDRYV